MTDKQTAYTPQLHGSEAIEKRCRLIMERHWPQHEIDTWLNLLTPGERAYAAILLQRQHHQTSPGAHHPPVAPYDEFSALTRWIDEPPMSQGNLSDADFKRAIWQKVDEDKWW